VIRLLVVTLVAVMALTSTAFASHPHQAICLVTATQPDGEVIQLLLQTESAREYVIGDPNKDVHDLRYQVRICDDDNDTSSCSTYQSKAVTHLETDEVTLVGMKDRRRVFFRGHITSDRIDGQLLHQGVAGKTFVPFSAKLDSCIAQSWVKLVPEAKSNAY